jgi:hypothetical protein
MVKLPVPFAFAFGVEPVSGAVTEIAALVIAMAVIVAVAVEETSPVQFAAATVTVIV